MRRKSWILWRQTRQNWPVNTISVCKEYTTIQNGLYQQLQIRELLYEQIQIRQDSRYRASLLIGPLKNSLSATTADPLYTDSTMWASVNSAIANKMLLAQSENIFWSSRSAVSDVILLKFFFLELTYTFYSQIKDNSRLSSKGGYRRSRIYH